MTLHIFNPGHDIALAANIANFTPPRAARQLHHDLGTLPALWAEPGDAVLIEDSVFLCGQIDPSALLAKERFQALQQSVGTRYIASVPSNISRVVPDITAVSPWGWNLALRARLRQMGIPDNLMPTDEQLDDIRRLSHRRSAAQLLQLICDLELPRECTTIDEVYAHVARLGRAVLKAPWSSSGRGIRFVEDSIRPIGPIGHISLISPIGHISPIASPALESWLRGILSRQGSVMVEPCYDKVKDFAMEFEAKADGTVAYCGLSLFHTANGAYTGNILATEKTKRGMIGRHIAVETIDQVKDSICRHLPTILEGHYQGPLGIDMMICSQPSSLSPQPSTLNPQHSTFIHPCVEINLRRTMGHVAIALTPTNDDVVGVMRIEYSDNRYSLNLSSDNPFLSIDDVDACGHTARHPDALPGEGK